MPRSRPKIQPQTKRNLLPFWLVLAGLGFVLLAVFALNTHKPQPKANLEVQGAPGLKVAPESIDHGNVKLGQTIRDTLQITNVGDQPLQLTRPPYIEVIEGC